MALVGHVDTITRGMIAGWVALPPGQRDGPPTLAVLVNGAERLTGQPETLPPGAGGSAAFRFEFEPPLSALREWRIAVVDAATRTPLPGGEYTLPRPSRDGTATPTPIVITSSGRAGTTLLMSEFLSNPEIVVADRYPYEIKQIAYYASVFRVLAGSADRERSAHPESMLRPERAHIAGSNPYNIPGLFDLAGPRALLAAYYESRVPARLASTFRALILEFYDLVRVGQGKPDAPYFCEKGDIDDAARQAARLFFPAVREIVLVRDPRDLLASSIAFWKLRPVEGLQMLERALPHLLEIQAAHAPDVLCVRYEDLMREPEASRGAIAAFLGVPVPADLPAPQTAAMAAHRTSSSLDASTGRWRQDLTAEQVATCEAMFRDYMAAFDYPPEPPGAAARRQAARRAGVAVVAEGSDVARLRHAGVDETPDGRPMRAAVKLEFGRGTPAAELLGGGWSHPEPGYVWSNAAESRLTLPVPPEPGSYRVWLTGLPLLHTEKLPRQTVTILVNEVEIGSVTLQALSVLAFDLPATEPGEAIALTLRLPDAARPRDLGTSADDRLLGLSLRWAMILHAAPAPAA